MINQLLKYKCISFLPTCCIAVVIFVISCKKEKAEISCKEGFSTIDYDYFFIADNETSFSSFQGYPEKFKILNDSSFNQHQDFFNTECFPEIDFTKKMLIINLDEGFISSNQCSPHSYFSVFTHVCSDLNQVEIKIHQNINTRVVYYPNIPRSIAHIFVMDKNFEDNDVNILTIKK